MNRVDKMLLDVEIEDPENWQLSRTAKTPGILT
jgi:hypothetical protein